MFFLGAQIVYSQPPLVTSSRGLIAQPVSVMDPSNIHGKNMITLSAMILVLVREVESITACKILSSSFKIIVR